MARYVILNIKDNDQGQSDLIAPGLQIIDQLKNRVWLVEATEEAIQLLKVKTNKWKVAKETSYVKPGPFRVDKPKKN